MLPQYSIPQKNKWIFKQGAAPTLATLAGAANGLWPLAARGLAGKNIFVRFLVQMKTLKFAFEIYWPLKKEKKGIYFEKLAIRLLYFMLLGRNLFEHKTNQIRHRLLDFLLLTPLYEKVWCRLKLWKRKFI